MNKMNIKRDGHLHTSFCPHGSKDIMEEYVKVAIEKGMKEISFTEHAPLPRSFLDPAPTKDSSMKIEDVPEYIKTGKHLKEKYHSQLAINIGFEVDYIEAYKDEIKDFLNRWGEDIDDAILSVHMIPVGEEYICMDYSAEEFGRLISIMGSVEKVHERYYQIVEQSIHADLGFYKPNRIGHLTLVNKFQKKYPVRTDYSQTIINLLKQLKDQDLELDANTAGWFKPDCEESYPPLQFIEEAAKVGITVIPGSDSHQAKGVAKGFSKLSI